MKYLPLVLVSLLFTCTGQILPAIAKTLPIQGVLLIKFKDSLNLSASYIFNTHQTFQAFAPDGNQLDGLMKKYKVKSIKPLYRVDPVDQSVPTVDILKAQENEKEEAIKRDYPQRTARAPKGVVLPTFYHVYVLEIDPNADIDQAAKDFSGNKDVEYAHPNYAMQTMNKGAHGE